MKSIGQNIQAARLRNGWSQAELAEKCGWKQSRISNYERDEREPKSSDVKIIATALGMSSQELIVGESLQLIISEDSKPYVTDRASFVPLISWVQAGTWSDIGEVLEPEVAEEFYPCPDNHSIHTFALRVSGESMAPEFKDGDIVFVDPEVEAMSGSCIVVRQKSNTQATFKQLIIDGDQKYLKALNPDWPKPIVEMLPDAEICGVVIGSYRKRS